MNPKTRVAAFLLCLLGATAACAQQRECPPGSYGLPVNTPAAGNAMSKHAIGMSEESAKKKAFLACSAADVAALRKADFKPGPIAASTPFASATVAALSRPGAKAADVQARLRAIYWNEMRSAGAGLPDYAGFWMRSQCQAAVPMLKSGEIPTYEAARPVNAILLDPTSGEMDIVWKMLEKPSTAELKISCAQALKRFTERARK